MPSRPVGLWARAATLEGLPECRWRRCPGGAHSRSGPGQSGRIAILITRPPPSASFNMALEIRCTPSMSALHVAVVPAGLPAIRLHDLRHTNASLALEAGVEMKVVSDRLGHSQISVTADLYTHVSRSLGNAAAEQIAGVLRAPSETVPTAYLPQAPKIDPSEDGEANANR